MKKCVPADLSWQSKSFEVRCTPAKILCVALSYKGKKERNLRKLALCPCVQYSLPFGHLSDQLFVLENYLSSSDGKLSCSASVAASDLA